ncbi:alpha-1,3/1,6-mannosyltransferase ALG2 [Patella vulgata]|uniref:alpha-1,3/1,6-mannosyltransferase ALG2 n=1 Tax=Patella vulgata TaxID=6465 RepID=UPI0021803EE5|nr:alpha-1,3/1,6-mannosyltransferase ALG2 [Patella vulgata]
MSKVVFLHPDLGIGGAERAVIDAALALKSRGHSVEFLTAHHDPTHCFSETKDGTFKITTVGDWLPRSIFGRFKAMCAYIRMIFAAFYLVFISDLSKDVDLIFCDQISACIPLLKFSKAKILFYCHFPDMLLTQRTSFLKKLYRRPIDWLEEKTTGMADCVLVNSKFTAGVFHDTFKSLSHIQPQVLYPIPDFSAFDKPIDDPTDDLIPSNKSLILLSINRYERKKNLPVAIQAFGKIKEKYPDNQTIHLIMAGGYDNRVTENVEHYQELKRLAKTLNLEDCVTFLRSFSDSQKRTLLKYSTCLIYTPDKEHFGIVPIEAMFMECPVIAVKSGGPLETVADGETGFLCSPTADDFAKAIENFVKKPEMAKSFGKAGKRRVLEKFSFAQFTEILNSIVQKLISTN